ncbi:SGNH/GDSL hydrolase family protein [Paenibacillus silvisoli]|uniref:SGNH/GDSL hydrolase family protein n=1 Tax=Paenibacillus silvisoli TaxID=3110539 RepID=UPI002804981C|nr:SGNH/GDSL hydrolase family protein [Paenibacillus silvisoli]
MELIQQWKKQPERSFRVIAFGSSNTEVSWSGRHNWVEWLNLNLKTHIGRQVSVINQGISGDTTQNLLERIERDVFSFHPSAVIVTIGGNDTFQGFSRQQYADNLKQICALIRANNALPILQTYYCPMYSLGVADFEETFESFMQINRQLASELDIPLIDQYRVFEPFYRKHPEDYAKLMHDWVHVNHIGNAIMGMHVSSAFGLPEFMLPEDIKQETLALAERMNGCLDR